PGSLYGMAFFPCVLDRSSDVIVTWPAISLRGRPSTWKAAVDRLVRPDRCRRRAFEGLLDRPAISLLKRFAHLGQILILLLVLLFLGQGFGGRVIQPIGIVLFVQGFLERPQIDRVKLGKMIDPIEPATLETAEDHLVDRRELRTLSNPDRPHVEIKIVVMLRACLPIQDLRQKTAASPGRTEIEHPAISRGDLVTVGEKVPEALPDQLADFPHGLHGTFLKVSGNLVERGFRRQGVPVVRPSERAKIAVETESLFITLRERGVEDGE